MGETLTYQETLERWKQLKEMISKLQGEERALREGLFFGTFPKPTEGTNKHILPDGSTLKGVHKINRNVVQDAVQKVPDSLRELVFKTTYSLILGEYKKLPKADQKVVDKALTITNGLPTLELVPPKAVAPGIEG